MPPEGRLVKSPAMAAMSNLKQLPSLKLIVRLLTTGRDSKGQDRIPTTIFQG